MKIINYSFKFSNFRWVLTAAHCVAGKSTLGMEILVGTNKIKNGGGKYHQAEHFKIHEDYTRNAVRRVGDIAILRIMGTFDFNDKVQPIELSSEEAPNGAVAGGHNYK